ncbi:MAG TPA: hypothetical protein VLE97_10760 [Gaiellaceae bacterium]|nr:hypothetical protein [Gaiellaceae bacterium]
MSTTKTLAPAVALAELRSLVATYLEGSDDAPRAHELLDALEPKPPVPAGQAAEEARPTQIERQRKMFGCTAAGIDEALAGKSARDVAMYAMGTLSNAQELIQRKAFDEDDVEYSVTPANANTIRQLMNVAKYAIDKAVPR